MKTISIVISICIMIGFTNSKCNAQESSSNPFLNEFCTYIRDFGKITGVLSYEMYYFTPEGKFYFKNGWSSGTYFVRCSSGTYRYNPSSNEITLHVRESFKRGVQFVDEEPDFTESQQTLHILVMTDSMFVIEDIRKNQLFPDKEFRRTSCGGKNIFALPCIEHLFAVEQIKVRNNDADLISVNDNDQKELLGIILTARYDRRNNGIERNVSLKGDYYTICLFMQELPDDSRVRIMISESSKSRIAVHCSDSGIWWYEIDETSGNRLMELLKKYGCNDSRM